MKGRYWDITIVNGRGNLLPLVPYLFPLKITLTTDNYTTVPVASTHVTLLVTSPVIMSVLSVILLAHIGLPFGGVPLPRLVSK